MNNTISIIIPCKARLQHLLDSLPTILAQTYQDLQVIIIDFNCPEGTKKTIEKEFSDNRIEVYKEKVGKDYWNLSESRNAGYKYIKGDRLLFLDADTMLQPTFIEMAVKQLNEKTFVTGLIAPPWNGCGCLFVNKSDYEKARGYNEALTGWGYDDIDMYKRLEKLGLTRIDFDYKLISNIAHEDSGRNKFHGNVDKYQTLAENVLISEREFKSSI